MRLQMKFLYILSTLLSFGIFTSCSEQFFVKMMESETKTHIQPLPQSVYGTYLAGRVAHLRQNYSTAADYYIKSFELGLKDDDILNSTYLLLASEGRIKQAAKYARLAQKDDDKTHLNAFIFLTDDMQEKDYDKAAQDILMLKGTAFEKNVRPLLNAWVFAARGEEKEAINTLESLKKDQDLSGLYYMHRGMINDYFDHQDEAMKDFETLVKNKSIPLSFRELQIIGNFYLRTGQKDKLIDMTNQYYHENSEVQMLGELLDSFKNTPEGKDIPKLIDEPQKGLAEAIFSVGTIFRGFQNEVAQLFTSLVLYLNPNLDVARIAMADLYEQSRRFYKANLEYDKVPEDSPVYYVAQLKSATNEMLRKKNDEALQKLQKLQRIYPDSAHIAFRLGEISRMMKQYNRAVLYYEYALAKLPEHERQRWTIYYALGIAYERQRLFDKSDKAFQKALKLSHRHPEVLNYLGYSWLERGTNTNEALYMIFEAHRKNPEDGHIIDSLGWALYKMGNYERAVPVLERASEYLPSNAVVFDHLGDAYWQIGRHNEARFQWYHALKAAEDQDELNEDEIKQKITNGLDKAVPLMFNEHLLTDRLKTLDGVSVH